MICPTYERFHTFSEPVEGVPFARQCACGERQPKAVNQGLGVTFSDVLIEKDDLRELLGWVEGPDYDPHGDFWRLMERVNSLLDD
jgi:hypothetical protein